MLCDDGNTCCCSVCYWAIVNKRIRQGQRGNSLLNLKWMKKEDAWQSFIQVKSHLRDHDAGIDRKKAWNVYQMELNKEHVEVKLGIRNKKEIEINNTGLRVPFDSILTLATRGIAYMFTVTKRKPQIYGILFISSLNLTVIAIRSLLQMKKSVNSCLLKFRPK